MTRKPDIPSSDDSWEKLEADLFGVEVGKEYTAADRIESELVSDKGVTESIVVPKPIEDDFGDFGAGLIDSDVSETPHRPSEMSAKNKTVGLSSRGSTQRATTSGDKSRSSKPSSTGDITSSEATSKPGQGDRPRSKSLGDPESSFGFEDTPTEEQLDAATVDEVDDTVEGVPEDDPYWDPLANWNWSEDEADGGRRGGRGKSQRPERGQGGPQDDSRRNRGAGRSSGRSEDASKERVDSPKARDSAVASRVDEGTDTGRAPVGENVPQSASPATHISVQTEETPVTDPRSRRRDRRRSRRHIDDDTTTAETASLEATPVGPSISSEKKDEWFSEPEVESERETLTHPEDSSRDTIEYDEAVVEDDLEEAEIRTETSPEADIDQRPRKRRRRRRGGRRPDRPHLISDSVPDEDLKHLEQIDDIADEVVDEVDEEDEELDVDVLDEEVRPARNVRRRNRTRGRRGESTAPPVRAKIEPPDDDFDELEDETWDEDRELDAEVDDEAPPPRRGRSVSKPARSTGARPGRPSLSHDLDDDDDVDLEDAEDEIDQEPVVPLEDVPSWEEAISYLLNPSLVEGAGSDRPESRRNDRGRERAPERPAARGDRSSSEQSSSERSRSERSNRGGDRSERSSRNRNESGDERTSRENRGGERSDRTDRERGSGSDRNRPRRPPRHDD